MLQIKETNVLLTIISAIPTADKWRQCQIVQKNNPRKPPADILWIQKILINDMITDAVSMNIYVLTRRQYFW